MVGKEAIAFLSIPLTVGVKRDIIPMTKVRGGNKMNNEGFGSNGGAFEYVVAKKGRTCWRRRLLLILAYTVWVVGIFIAGVVIKLILPLLCFIPLSVWIFIFLTWRWSKEEIKLSFLGGGLTVTRQYDGKNPKVLYEARLRDLRLVTGYTKEKLEEYQKASGREILYATRTEQLDGSYLAVWDGRVLVFEANDKALKIIKYYCDSENYDL